MGNYAKISMCSAENVTGEYYANKDKIKLIKDYHNADGTGYVAVYFDKELNFTVNYADRLEFKGLMEKLT